MARFWVHRLGPNGDLALDLQASILDGLHTRVVAPLVRHDDVTRLVPRLNPRFEIGGQVFVMMTEFIATVPLKDMGERVTDLSHRADEITAATDFLFRGF
ncbi:CcdB family protein [Rhizobium sp. CSW-27]|uniref:CcdB family protein n=1 Tax=Rhizobium sp. CSW-27 TaxID=2839985 RepID=UPI001C02BB05|nr:CcdB family protein [Rhizobium sp. CSW-27]MBT9371432.1 CcdB family protein [Rhizobium sp. CSW-27]